MQDRILPERDRLAISRKGSSAVRIFAGVQEVPSRMSSLCSKSILVQILQGHWGMLLVCYRKEDRSGAPKMIDVCRRDGEQFDLVGLKQWA